MQGEEALLEYSDFGTESFRDAVEAFKAGVARIAWREFLDQRVDGRVDARTVEVVEGHQTHPSFWAIQGDTSIVQASPSPR